MAKKNQIKTFVLDTNVILHDPTCLTQFSDNDVVIPLTVIEEIDKFKRGSQVINLNAREFTRTLDSLTKDSIFDLGISLGKGKGKIKICISRGLAKDIKESFREDTPDHRILSAAYNLHLKSEDKQKVILVTKDVNLRMKAKAMGVLAQDYETDRIGNAEGLYSGKEVIDDFDDDSLSKIFEPPYVIPLPEDAEKKYELFPNKYFIIRNSYRSVLASYNKNDHVFEKLETKNVYGIKPRNAEQSFAIDELTDPNLPLVTITGKAGTGKTLLALSSALSVKSHFRQIYVARPVVPLSNKDLGFLPGDIESKLAPYMRPLWDNLKVIQDQFPENDRQFIQINTLLKEDKLVIEPLSYIRGRSLQRIYFIVDEAQNLTPHEVKTIITRAGEGAKIVLTGDIHQIDHPYLDTQSNGLSYLIEHFKGQDLYAHVNLEKGERSELAELASNLL